MSHSAAADAPSSRPTRQSGWLAAAAAIDADLVGVDLIPIDGGHLVLELNGAAEFDHAYDLPGSDVYVDAARALALAPSAVAA